MKFPYTKLPNRLNGRSYALRSSTTERNSPYFGLIDSGADINLFHGELAGLLGI